MFWRRKKDKKEESSKKLELPPLEELQIWVPALISSFELVEGTFTFLPAYGGILLFIQNEGITWLPYEEIKEVLGKVDKTKIAESSALIGSVAVVTATGGAFLPILLVRGILKGSYRTFVKPPPNITLSFLKSMIENVVLTKHNPKSKKLLNTFEGTPYRDKENQDFIYSLYIRRKVYSAYYEESRSLKFLQTLKNFLSRSIIARFTIPGQADIDMFVHILRENGIQVEYEVSEPIEEVMEDEAIENQ